MSSAALCETLAISVITCSEWRLCPYSSGERPPDNNARATCHPSFKLVQRHANLFSCIRTKTGNRFQ